MSRDEHFIKLVSVQYPIFSTVIKISVIKCVAITLSLPSLVKALRCKHWVGIKLRTGDILERLVGCKSLFDVFYWLFLLHCELSLELLTCK